MPGRTAIFIDGAYFEYALREEYSSTRIDFKKLSDAMGVDADILRTYYYHCPPYQGSPPTIEESERYASRRKFYTALDRLPRYTVRLGRLAYRGQDADGKPRYEQKRVDILLGVDLVQLSAKGQIQEAILVAGDSDFIPAVDAAQSDGVLVRLYHGQNPHSDLWQKADERIPFSQEFINGVAL